MRTDRLRPRGVPFSLFLVSKAERIAHLRVEGKAGLNPHYAGWFVRFNRGEYYEAHDVLEHLWLKERRGPKDAFYKGLIQLAGAYVHLQKGRLKPADALFRLAQNNLTQYPEQHEQLDLRRVLLLIAEWRTALQAGDFLINPLGRLATPRILPEGIDEEEWDSGGGVSGDR